MALLLIYVPDEHWNAGLGHRMRFEALREALAERGVEAARTSEAWQGSISLSPAGMVVLSDGTELSDLRYAILRKGFAEMRTRGTIRVDPPGTFRVCQHHSLDMGPKAIRTLCGVSPRSHSIEVVELGPITPWLEMSTTHLCITFPCTTALEAHCLGIGVHLLDGRNDGEINLGIQLAMLGDSVSRYRYIDGLGAQRVADYILKEPTHDAR